jgi:succinyl-CoA synthetase beta subunit
MKLHEYQAKQIFSKFGIPIPRGNVANNSDHAKQIAEELNSPVVIKAQVQVGGRGKAGGIRLAKIPKEAELLATQILGMNIHGYSVKKVLVEEAINIDRELYLAITIDRSTNSAVMIVSESGGIDIEKTAQVSPEKVTRIYIDTLLGLKEFQIRSAALSIDLPRKYWQHFLEIALSIWRVFVECDASLVEINPLAIASNQEFVSLDGKLVVDDNALFRHSELAELRDLEIEPPGEIEARKYGLNYIQMDGNIGCLVNGAGLAMATMDMIKISGGEPANFLDIGGGASAEKVGAALHIMLNDVRVRAILVNIFGGITRCDEVAKGILSTLKEVNLNIPMVIRFKGNGAEMGLKMLSSARMETAVSFQEAAEKVVALTN